MKYKPGDTVLVVKAYPGVNPNSIYNPGMIVTLIKQDNVCETYWYTDIQHSTMGIFERCFVPATKLHKALK